jgi:regulator of protease activity HflC (stomatin/prohibitin superfamily)
MVKWMTGLFVAMMATFFAGNAALYLMRQADDLAVLGGVCLLFIVAVSWSSFIGARLKKFLDVVPLVLLAMFATGCTRIQPGYSGIVVNSWGEDKGVESYPLRTGRVTYNPWTTDVFEYPNFMQSGQWDGDHAIACNDRDGLVVGLNIAFGYQLDPSKIPAFYVKYRTEDISAFSAGYLRNEAQGIFNVECPKFTAEQIYGTGKETLLATVKQRVNDKMAPDGVLLGQFSTVGKVVLPPAIEQSITNKITAIQNAQRVENELRETEAAAKKVVAEAKGQAESAIEKARGQAEANRLLTSSLTTTLLEWRRLTIQEAATNKWNGAMPATMLGDTVPFIQVPK